MITITAIASVATAPAVKQTLGLAAPATTDHTRPAYSPQHALHAGTPNALKAGEKLATSQTRAPVARNPCPACGQPHPAPGKSHASGWSRGCPACQSGDLVWRCRSPPHWSGHGSAQHSTTHEEHNSKPGHYLLLHRHCAAPGNCTVQPCVQHKKESTEVTRHCCLRCHSACTPEGPWVHHRTRMCA